MEYRAFGKTGIQISAIGIGCWEIGGGYGSIEETEFIKAVNRALDLGINCFDTAEAYGFGASEVSLAKCGYRKLDPGCGAWGVVTKNRIRGLCGRARYR